jgi:hypothetical protein
MQCDKLQLLDHFTSSNILVAAKYLISFLLVWKYVFALGVVYPTTNMVLDKHIEICLFPVYLGGSLTDSADC